MSASNLSEVRNQTKPRSGLNREPCNRYTSVFVERSLSRFEHMVKCTSVVLISFCFRADVLDGSRVAVSR